MSIQYNKVVTVRAPIWVSLLISVVIATITLCAMALCMMLAYICVDKVDVWCALCCAVVAAMTATAGNKLIVATITTTQKVKINEDHDSEASEEK